jgi:hypothetical protein
MQCGRDATVDMNPIPLKQQACQGPVPRVPQATGYNPTNLDTAKFPPAAKVGNQILHTK